MTAQRTDPRYRLDSRIATGGMGEVWRGTDTVLDRRVAVKVLKPEFADDPTFRSRFEGEARHAAALHHHNVASVFDFGELETDDGSGVPRPFLVMELVPGRPLSTLLRDDKTMPPDKAADLVAQAADGVASAHALGIVHRDVKPGNLLVTPRGQVKVTDFGIARAADGAALTQTGQVIGTPAYIAPEQAEGRPATAASDIYSLGVVLYECLAGRRPFGGDTPVSTALAHLRDAPPPLPDHVPPHLRDVVTTALAKDPGQRFPTMSAFASALRGGAIDGAAPAGAARTEPVPLATEPADGGTRILTSPVAAATSDTAAAPRSARSASGRPPWLPWAVAAAALLVLVVLVSVLSGRGDPAPTAAEPRPSASPEPSSTEPARVRVRAQDYVGLPFAEARAKLVERGLEPRRRTVTNPGGEDAATVRGVAPTGMLAEGTEVTLSVWGPVPEPTPDVSDDGGAQVDGGKDKPDKGSKSGGKGSGKGKKKGHQ